MAEYVFHYTGKGNQSYVMKDAEGTPVYEAICEKFKLFGDTPFRFCNHLTGVEEPKAISHTVTFSSRINGFGGAVSSGFKVNGINVWDLLAGNGYDFTFHLESLTATSYEVTHDHAAAGLIVPAGTGVMNPKYANSPLGKLPTRGIYKITCEPEDVPGFFMICFALSKTEMSMNEIL